MHMNDISRQKFSKIASRRFQGRMTLTGQGLVLGAGTMLAKLDDKALPIGAEQESGFGRSFRSPTGMKCRLRYWVRFAALQNTGTAATRVSPRFIWR